jgi:hypothetical protein
VHTRTSPYGALQESSRESFRLHLACTRDTKVHWGRPMSAARTRAAISVPVVQPKFKFFRDMYSFWGEPE